MANDPTTPPRAKMLGEVVITAKRYKKATEAKAKLYPSGEVAKSTVDSLVKAGRGKLIGDPIKRPGQIDEYGAQASDVIRQLTKKK
jgi:hypothetical protein